jgi:hypothetical protein
MELPIDIVEADLERADHQRDIVALTAAYALDPMGNAGPQSRSSTSMILPCCRRTAAGESAASC